MAARSVAELDAEWLELKDEIKQLKRYITNAEQELETRLQLLRNDKARLNNLDIKADRLERMFPFGLLRSLSLLAHSVLLPC